MRNRPVVKKSLVIYGPAGCGKTFHADALGRYFGLPVIDSYDAATGYGVLLMPQGAVRVGPVFAQHGFLYLLERKPSSLYKGSSVLSFEEAMAQAGLVREG